MALSLIFVLFAKTLELYHRSRLHSARALLPTRINILKESFENEVITVSDLWDFQRQIISGKRFHKCRFSGPMVLAFLDNVTANGFNVSDSIFIEIGDSNLTGVIGFRNCILTQCEYDNITFIIHESLAQQLRESSKGQINFVARPKSTA